MRCGKSAWRNWTSDTLTAMVSAYPWSIHSRNWRVAVCSTQSPMGRIMPLDSATGMNSAGDTRPSSGCSQRSKASAPTMAPLATQTCGW